jgi:hypothetical protein
MANNTFLAPLSPIQRSTPSDRLLVFQKNETQIYNKFSPYYQAGQDLGSDQPYIYVKLTDSSIKKNLTKYDSQALPAGSLVRDVQRLTKFTTSGKGLLFIGKQILIQGQAAFDETRTYNVGSVIGSAGGSTIGSLVRSILPTGNTNNNYGVPRHIEGRGLLNFFAGSLLSTIGMQTNSLTNSSTPIPGTATGPEGGPNALSTQVQVSGGGRYGLMRGETASGGRANFDKVWVGAARPTGNRGFLQSIMRAVASTTGLFSNSGRPADWEYRPEYGKRSRDDNAYNKMYFDVRKKLSFKGRRGLYQIDGVFSFGNFYNDLPSELDLCEPEIIVQDVMRTNTPVFLDSNGSGADASYASKRRVTDRYNKIEKSGLEALYRRMLDIDLAQNEDQHPMYNKSAERYEFNRSAKINENNNYKKIPDPQSTDATNGPYFYRNPYYTSFSQKGLTLEQKGFGKVVIGGPTIYGDEYNQLSPYNSEDGLNLARNNIPIKIAGDQPEQSQDIIFFYFYDLINEMYIPFRATLSGIQDQNSADWDSIAYLGRADKLFVYRGFTRDLSFNFKVYANSIYELVPNWERVNYLVGLTRPSKYTGASRSAETTTVVSRGPENDTPPENNTSSENNTEGLLVDVFAEPVNIGGTGVQTSRNRSASANDGFMYPPMIEFRIGDLYVDQPGILRSVNVSIPEESQWETLRDDNYKYRYGAGEPEYIGKPRAKSRQLPTIIDVSVQISMLEKARPLTENYHFGPNPQEGWNSL